jgi:site-specific DNA recombinase
MKVAIYGRVSTDSENQLNSLENQQRFYTDYCREKGYELVKFYADEGLTGTNMKREEFLNMLHDAGLDIKKDEISTRFIKSDRKPKFNKIITKDVSRFSRNTNVMEVVDLLREKKVYIIFQNANINTEDENYTFLLTMFLNFAQQESIDRSQKVKFGLKQRAKDGKMHFAGERLFGYFYNIESKTIDVIETEVDIVKWVFKMYTEDLKGSRQIADLLNAKGYKTQNDKIWTANAIVRMLKNEKYTGNVNLLKTTYGDVKKENRQKKLKDKNDWIFKENLIPSLISVDTFIRTQEIMKSRTSEGRGINTPNNLFSQKIKCAKCGKNYIRSNQKQNDTVYYFFSCATRRRTGECDNQSVTLKRLENEMQPYCDGKLYDYLQKQKGVVIHLFEAKIIGLEMKKVVAESKQVSIRHMIEDKEKEINELIDSFVGASVVVKKAVERKIETLESERIQLESEIFDYDLLKIESDIVKLNETIFKLNKATQQKIFTIEEALAFVDRIVVDGEKIEIKFALDKLLPHGHNLESLLMVGISDMTTNLRNVSEQVKEIKKVLK